MKHPLFILAFLLIAANLSGQETKSAPCSNSDKTFTRPQFAPTFGNGEADIQTFFDTAFASIKKTKCKINLTLLVDSIGKPSVSGVIFEPAGEMDEKTMKMIIATMPNWKPGIVRNCDVVVALPIFLDVTKKGVKVNYHKVQYN